ncbi:MAG TPA: Na/Pi symporter [Chitinophagaceae bacterium]|nr:Na/Pi symporter [Chitinophagaceae bacterium]
MLFSADIWKFLAGIAIFLLGMNFLEESLRHLAGRPFKLFLKKQTSNKLKGITGGAIVTGILQSSSIVNLMVLAFVGAGVIQMQNALAVILGANLGTTLNSWIIATVGFSFNLEDFALPAAGISGIIMMLVNKESRWYQWSKLIFGFSFLFIGLNYIKTGIEGLVQHVNLDSVKEQPAIVFLIIGFLITSLVQSSSATVAIALSALNVNAISLVSAMAIVLGAEVGTTIKLVLASIKGIAAKKRVAAGNFLFNSISTVIVLILLNPINYFIIEMVGIRDNLIALVFFQSLVNLAGIILFYPLLEISGKFLEKRFAGKDDESLFISKVSTADGDLALDALEKETHNFIFHVLSFTVNAFDNEYEVPETIRDKDFERKQVREKYEHIKNFYGDIHRFSVRFRNTLLHQQGLARLDQLISCIRNGMYAAKNIQDALHDIDQLRNSSNDVKYDFYKKNENRIVSFCKNISTLLAKKGTDGNLNEVTGIYENIQKGYTENLQELYKEGMAKHLSQSEISTLINFNREMYTAYKSFVFAIKDFLLDHDEAKHFDELPGFIR